MVLSEKRTSALTLVGVQIQPPLRQGVDIHFMQILGSPALAETIRLVDVFLQARTALAAMLPKTVMVRYKKW